MRAMPQQPAVVSSNVLLAIVNASGVIDAASVGPFERELANAVSAGATKLLVDLTRAEEVTTAGMNALLGVRGCLAAVGGQVAVVLPPAIRWSFGVLGLDRRFLVADDRTEGARLLGLMGGAEPESGAPAPRARAA
jgi:anti-anti-sigma regulatory factor